MLSSSSTFLVGIKLLVLLPRGLTLGLRYLRLPRAIHLPEIVSQVRGESPLDLFERHA